MTTKNIGERFKVDDLEIDEIIRLYASEDEIEESRHRRKKDIIFVSIFTGVAMISLVIGVCLLFDGNQANDSYGETLTTGAISACFGLVAGNKATS